MGTIVLGAGIAGISAGYHLNKQEEEVVIYEKNNDWGGLCGNFTIDGFRFDKFVHFSFAEKKYIVDKFKSSGELYEHIPYPSNYYKGYWLRHPAQNNLAPLSSNEKSDIICDFVNRPIKAINKIENYEEWLRVQYGNYFAENFPFRYTRKYWGVEPSELGTKWVGQRMYTPDLKQVLNGAFETQEECFYYAKKMKYPKKGGFRSILNTTREGLDIRFNKEVVEINIENKTITFKDNTVEKYDRLVSSLPLPEIVKMIPNCPQKVLESAQQLKYTSGYMVSLGFNKPDIAKYLWFYIYDEDILTSRVYSPNLKSSDNVPNGCSSLQAEIFWSGANNSKMPNKDFALNNTIDSLIKMGIFKKEDLILKDIRYEKYANVIFDKDIYKNRQIVLDYLKEQNIDSIGRFGKWEYMWTHQAYEDGISICKNYKELLNV